MKIVNSVHTCIESATKYKKGKKLAMVLAKTQTYLTQHHYHTTPQHCDALLMQFFCSQLGALVCNGLTWVQNLQGNFNRDFIAGYTLVAIAMKHCFLFYSQMILIMVFFNCITSNDEYLKYLYIIVVPLGGSTSEKRYLAFSLSFLFTRHSYSMDDIVRGQWCFLAAQLSTFNA